MLHYNTAIIYEVGASSYMKATTNQTTTGDNSPPVMSPINPQDNNGNLVQMTYSTPNTNKNLKGTLNSYFDKLIYIFKICGIVLAILLVLGLFGIGRQKSKKGQGGSKTKDYVEKGIIALIVYWLIKKFFGKEIKNSINKVESKINKHPKQQDEVVDNETPTVEKSVDGFKRRPSKSNQVLQEDNVNSTTKDNPKTNRIPDDISDGF